MDPERWLQITDVFDLALEYPPEERKRYAEIACAADQEILSEVLRLLAEFESAGDFLEQPAAYVLTMTPGKLINGRYHVEALLGRGGMGEVYRVLDQFLNERVALKILRPEWSSDPDLLRCFQREVQLARKVTHPNVCRVFDLGIDGASEPAIHFFTMQFIEGETLAARIQTRGHLPAHEAFPLIRQMAEGLHAAHEAGIVHRDFKSANVMLSEGRAVITDFGLARPDPSIGAGGAPGTITMRVGMAGTIAYMSPEQLSGGLVNALSDIYSLGIVMFEMATGQLPFDGRHIIQSAMQRAGDSVPDVRALAPGIDGRWADAITRCLQRDPKKRFTNAFEIAQQLRRARSPLPAIRWSRREWTAAAIFSAAGVSLSALASRFYQQKGTVPQGTEAFLAPMLNSTGDPRFDGISELFRSQLSQSVHLSILTEDRLGPVLRQMGQKADTNDPSALREASWRMNAALSVYGSVSMIGSDYALSVQMETRGSEPQKPRHKALRSFPAADPSVLMNAVREASRWVRETVGESASDIASFDRLPADVTTSSWEALSSYSRGQKFFMQQDYEAAILEFESALRLDPRFTLAALRRADLLFSQNRQAEAFEQYRAAMALLRDHPVTRAEELYARGMFAHDSGDLESADRYYRTWSQEYPYDWRAPFYRVSCLCLNGNAAQALDLLKQLHQKMPEYGDIYAQMINCNIILGQTEEAHALVPELRKRNRPERADLHEASVRFREANCVGCLEILRSVEHSTTYRRGTVDAMLQEGLLLIDAGYPEAAAANIERFLRAGSWVETVPEQNGLRVAQAWAEMLAGRSRQAVEHARQAVEADTGPLLTALTGTIFARLGSASLVERSLNLCDRLSDIPLYQIARFRILGERERAAGRIEPGIELLRKAAALEPKIAHRQYLIEALLEKSPERLELARNIARLPWQNLRSPVMHHIGAVGLAVRILTNSSGSADPFVTKFARSSQELGKAL